MKQRRCFRAVAIVGLAFSALTVNSGAAGAASAAKFRAAADEICTALAEDYVEIQQRNGLPQSLAEDVANAEELVPLIEDANAELSKLKPPKKLRADFREYLSLREERVENDKAFLEAGAANDQARVDELSQKLTEIRDGYEAVGANLGFYACAERLHKKEAQKVRDVVEETWTNGDPDFCTEKYTEEFVRVYAGSLEQCVSIESDPASGADSVDIEFVKGVDKVRATARLTPQGGADDGRTFETDMIYEDGVYKRQAIYPV